MFTCLLLSCLLAARPAGDLPSKTDVLRLVHKLGADTASQARRPKSN